MIESAKFIGIIKMTKQQQLQKKKRYEWGTVLISQVAILSWMSSFQLKTGICKKKKKQVWALCLSVHFNVKYNQ